MPKDNKNFFKTKSRWSEIKDQLLGCYLTPYFQKLLMTGKPLFYVDCFAGKGKFDDGNPGSPIIALQTRDVCLSRTTKQNVGIDTCFIDLNYAQELRSNIIRDPALTQSSPSEALPTTSVTDRSPPLPKTCIKTKRLTLSWQIRHST
jgi:three-Cys-motif partner protein